MIGAGNPAADVELITVALETLRSLGLKDIKVKLSHAGIIRALLAGFGLSPEAQGKAFDRMLDGDTAVISQLKTQNPELVNLLSPLLEMKGANTGFLKNQQAVFTRQLPEFAPALENFIQITEMLTATGQKYEIDIASGTGFEYYTGLIFQLYAKNVKVGGGGRYDALIPLLGGKDVPASGFALYMDPIMNLIPQYASDEAAGVNVILKKPEASNGKRTFELLNRLHAVGLRASLFTEQTPPENGWRVEVNDNFTVSGPGLAKPRAVASIEEVLGLLGGKQ